MFTKDSIVSVKKYNWGNDWNYQVTHSGGVTGVPNDPSNVECQIVLEWGSESGNNIADATN